VRNRSPNFNERERHAENDLYAAEDRLAALESACHRTELTPQQRESVSQAVPEAQRRLHRATRALQQLTQALQNGREVDLPSQDPDTETRIKVGDRVLCIDDRWCFQKLRFGAEYTAEARYDGTPTVVARNASHLLDRFVLIESTRESGRPPER
jgi:hypothetical protein